MPHKPFLLLAALLATASIAAAQTAPKVSEFNRYSGYSQPVYDGWVRSSRYVVARDGTRLAVDIFRPARGGKVAEEKLPVVWTHHRYQRAHMEEGQVSTILDSYEWLPEVVRHGYVVAAVDVRGSGASFGTFTGMFNLPETQDAYDITEWLAAQPWSNGNVGMYGGSYLGITQYMAAGQKPPHLKAIFPAVAVSDLYDLLWHGGIFHGPFIESWSKLVRQLDVDRPALPVDEDKDGSLLKAAIQEHRANRDAAKLYAALPFRDSADPQTGVQVWRDWTPITYLKQIRESKVAVYQLAGWYDRYVRDQTILFRNLDNPQKLTIGPWTHTESDLGSAAEPLRWWDRWLKGIDNGVMDDAPVHYYVMGAPEAIAWRSAKAWPLPNERRTAYWFGPRRSLGTVAPKAAPGDKGRDEMTVDYSAAVSPDPRWSLERKFPELSAHDAKGFTYTTPPLAAAVEVTGHPVVHLWISSSAPDADLFVYLEEVDGKGASRYVTEGMLRASDRATADPGYDTAGLPYHRGNRADRDDLAPGQPVELVFDLYPTSTLFAAGHRIRVTVTGADKTNAVTPRRNPPPRITLYREAGKSSYVELPVIPD
jgi:putative CocE/NonD family hydrolase